MEIMQTIDEVFQAAQSGDAQRLKLLLEANPGLASEENRDGLTPLGYAAHFGNQAVVQTLLDFGADVNAVSHSKLSYIPSNTALHAAIAGERSMEVIGLLLASGAKTDVFDSNGHTCLHSAAFHDDNEALIELLIGHGAQVNAKAEGGVTALELAEQRGNEKVIGRLLRHGAVR